jgi:hypothetical protein
MGKSIYIAGPMTGYENYNFPAFDRAKNHLRMCDYETIHSPADMDRELGIEPDTNGDIENFDYRAAIKRCCKAVCESDAIYMLSGWELSKGARMEHSLALCLDLEITYE